MDYKRQGSPSVLSLGKKIRTSDSLISAQLNNKYNISEFKSKISSHFKQKSSFRDGTGAETHSEPFFSCFLPNFIENEDYLMELKEDLLDQEFFAKSNDLYQFQQSDDLKNLTSLPIDSLRKLLYEDFLNWLIEVTEIPLRDTVDMSCSKFCYKDVLLCHDDELEDRRIAFIFYLVPSWNEEDGGLLNFFNTTENGNPCIITKSFVPQWNSLIFFEVSPSSFHQVSEILMPGKTRLSISGWFHGPKLPRCKPFLETYPLLPPGHVEEELIYSWISPSYLDAAVQSQIQIKFERESEIELQGFFKEEKFKLLSKAFCSSKIQWSEIGPPNKRHYEQAGDNLPSIIKDCLRLMKSQAMFLILSNLTGLTLHELAEENGSDSKAKSEDESEINPGCHVEVRRWSHRCYTLVHDDISTSTNVLDAVLFLNCKGWESSVGGFTSFIAKDEDEELLHIDPSENSLALVYRDPSTVNFVKYINCGIEKMQGGSSFHDIHIIYCENCSAKITG